jgi:hypothetical protein
VAEPRRRFDPLALTVLSVAVAVIVVISAFLIYRLRSDEPPPATAPDTRLRDAVAEVEKWIESMQTPPPAVKPAPPPVAVAPPKPLPLPPVPRGFELIDERPPKDRRDFDPNDGWGAVVVGDAHFVPDRVSALRERMTGQASKQLEGKRVRVIRLVTWYVRTPRGPTVDSGVPGVPPMAVEKAFGVPEIRQHPYWVICHIVVMVDNRSIGALGTEGFGGKADFGAHHERALLRGIDAIIKQL